MGEASADALTQCRGAGLTRRAARAPAREASRAWGEAERLRGRPGNAGQFAAPSGSVGGETPHDARRAARRLSLDAAGGELPAVAAEMLEAADFISSRTRVKTCANCVHNDAGVCQFDGEINGRPADLRGQPVNDRNCCYAWEDGKSVRDWRGGESRKGGFNESQHPRAEDGRFGDKPGEHGGEGKPAAGGRTATPGTPVPLDRAGVHPEVAAASAAYIRDGLSAERRESLIDYAGTGYKELNRKMRQCPPDFRCVGGDLRRQMEAVRAALDDAPPLPRPTTVWRGLGGGPALATRLFEEARRCQESGGEFSMPCFTSASALPEVAVGRGDVVFRIRAKTGLYLEGLGPGKGEHEILQSPRALYKVVGAAETPYTRGGVTVRTLPTVYLEEI